MNNDKTNFPGVINRLNCRIVELENICNEWFKTASIQKSIIDDVIHVLEQERDDYPTLWSYSKRMQIILVKCQAQPKTNSTPFHD